jgi:hypothetical protein
MSHNFSLLLISPRFILLWKNIMEVLIKIVIVIIAVTIHCAVRCYFFRSIFSVQWYELRWNIFSSSMLYRFYIYSISYVVYFVSITDGSFVDGWRDNHILSFYPIIYYRYTEHTKELQLEDLKAACWRSSLLLGSLCMSLSVLKSKSKLLYDLRFTANQFVFASSPLRPTTRIIIFFNWTLYNLGSDLMENMSIA